MWCKLKNTCFLSLFYSCIKLKCSLFKRDNAYLLTAIAEHQELSSWIINSLYGLLWDTSWKSHVTCTSGTFCTTSLGNDDAKGSHEVAAARKSAELSRWASRVALESKCFNLRGEPLSRTSSQSSRLGERSCGTAGEKTTKTSRWATWQNHSEWNDSVSVLEKCK